MPMGHMFRQLSWVYGSFKAPPFWADTAPSNCSRTRIAAGAFGPWAVSGGLGLPVGLEPRAGFRGSAACGCLCLRACTPRSPGATRGRFWCYRFRNWAGLPLGLEKGAGGWGVRGVPLAGPLIRIRVRKPAKWLPVADLAPPP